MAGARVRWPAAALAVWPALLAAVLCWPLLSGGGHPLARDLVFVPRQPLTDAALGLGEGLPRAVPLDSVVSLLTTVVEGGVLARLLVPLAVALAGWGVLRLLPDASGVARLAACSLAVWNPYVVERLALGQWALLLGYGALPWIVAAASRHRRTGSVGDLATALAWSALASLTPTGGLLACAAVVSARVGRARRSVALLVGAVLLQAPWLTAALTSRAATTSDAAGASVFGPDTNGPGGPLVALLGLAGIWDDASEPATRGSWWAVAAAVVTCSLLVAGASRLRGWWGRGDHLRFVMLAGALALLPLAAALPGGADLVAWIVREVPGAGLLRDSQKLLAPAVLLVAASLAAVTDGARARVARHGQEALVSATMVLLAVPFVLLPDATTVTWPTVEPVRYPEQVRAAYEAAAGDRGHAAGRRVAVLPWRTYRLFEWGNGLTSSDPAQRWLDAEVLGSDELQVGQTVVQGESRLLAEIGEALASSPPARALPQFGVERVIVYRDDPAAAQVETDGLVPLYVGSLVAAYEVPGASTPPGVSRARRGLVVAAHVTWLLLAAGSVAGVIVTRRRRPATDV